MWRIRLLRLAVDVSSVHKYVFAVCYVARRLGKSSSPVRINTFSLFVINLVRVSLQMLPVTFPLLIAFSRQYRRRFDDSMVRLSCGEVVFGVVPFPMSSAAFHPKTPFLPATPIDRVLHMGFGDATYSLDCQASYFILMRLAFCNLRLMYADSTILQKIQTLPELLPWRLKHQLSLATQEVSAERHASGVFT